MGRAGKMAAQKQPQSIDISQLPLPQLNSLNQQLEQEIEFLGNSLSQLKTLQAKFNESQECVGKLSGQESGKQMLVPLTGSMYVQGEIAETDKVLIDVGTGYYMEKTCEGAKGYFQRKVDYLTKQMEKLQPVVQEKYKLRCRVNSSRGQSQPNDEGIGIIARVIYFINFHLFVAPFLCINLYCVEDKMTS